MSKFNLGAADSLTKFRENDEPLKQTSTLSFDRVHNFTQFNLLDVAALDDKSSNTREVPSAEECTLPSSLKPVRSESVPKVLVSKRSPGADTETTSLKKGKKR